MEPESKELAVYIQNKAEFYERGLSSVRRRRPPE